MDSTRQDYGHFESTVSSPPSGHLYLLVPSTFGRLSPHAPPFSRLVSSCSSDRVLSPRVLNPRVLEPRVLEPELENEKRYNKTPKKAKKTKTQKETIPTEQD
jgi:hypothetical protein